jgi:hypothetical protein
MIQPGETNVGRAESVQTGENDMLPGESVGHRRRVDEPHETPWPVGDF